MELREKAKGESNQTGSATTDDGASVTSALMTGTSEIMQKEKANQTSSATTDDGVLTMSALMTGTSKICKCYMGKCESFHLKLS